MDKIFHIKGDIQYKKILKKTCSTKMRLTQSSFGNNRDLL